MAMALGRSLGKWRVAACTQEEARKRAQLELSHRIEQDTLKRTLTTKIEQHQSDALQIRLEAQAKGTERRREKIICVVNIFLACCHRHCVEKSSSIYDP